MQEMKKATARIRKEREGISCVSICQLTEIAAAIGGKKEEMRR